MRCILVSNTNLKSDTHCTYCRQKIGDSYAREIGSRLIYCDYDCYQSAVKTPVVTLNARVTSMNTWTVNATFIAIGRCDFARPRVWTIIGAGLTTKPG
jgi:hypothetical protein